MRALLLALDGAGCGNAPDAQAFGDGGANTLGHFFKSLPTLELPVLDALGLWKLVTGDVFSHRSLSTIARWGRLRPCSVAKSPIMGLWELAGVISKEPFATFPQWPTELLKAISRDAHVRFLSDERHSGESPLMTLGEEHLRTGRPIFYICEESILHFAAHDSVVSATKLYEICRIARKYADAQRIVNVVARPFTGVPGAFCDAPGIRDFPIVPPRTILNAIAEKGVQVQAVGEIASIFAGSGITLALPAESDLERMRTIEELWTAESDGLIFANLSGCDEKGQKRDMHGFGVALQRLDSWLASFLPLVEPEDLIIITSTHGRDPAFIGTGRTREETPLLVLHGGETGPLGTRRTFADTAATLGEFFRLRKPWHPGNSFLHTKTKIPKLRPSRRN